MVNAPNRSHGEPEIVVAGSHQTTDPTDAKQMFSKNSDFPFTSLTETCIGSLHVPSPNTTICPPNTQEKERLQCLRGVVECTLLI